jgi:hypothetical protein
MENSALARVSTKSHPSLEKAISSGTVISSGKGHHIGQQLRLPLPRSLRQNHLEPQLVA